MLRYMLRRRDICSEDARVTHRDPTFKGLCDSRFLPPPIKSVRSGEPAHSHAGGEISMQGQVRRSPCRDLHAGTGQISGQVQSEEEEVGTGLIADLFLHGSGQSLGKGEEAVTG
jgi:hypothetical protein